MKYTIYVALGVAALSADSVASALPSGVILDFEGYRAKRARLSVLFAISSLLEIVPRSELSQVAEDLGYDLSNPDGLRAACDDLELSIVLRGRVEGRGRRAKTVVEIVHPAGHVLERVRGGSPGSGRARKHLGRRVAGALRGVLGELDVSPERFEPDEDDASDFGEPSGYVEADLTESTREPERGARRRVVRPVASDLGAVHRGDRRVVRASEPSLTRRVVSTARRRDRDAALIAAANEELGLDPRIDATSEPPPWSPPASVAYPQGSVSTQGLGSAPSDPAATSVRTEARPTRRDDEWLSIVAGLDVRSRAAGIDQTDGRSARFSSGLFPELVIRADLLPFDRSASLSGLGFRLDLAQAVGLSALARAREVDSSATRLRLGAGYVARLGSVGVGGGASFVYDRFSFGTNEVMDTASYPVLQLDGRVAVDLPAGWSADGEVDLGYAPSAGALGERYRQSPSALGFGAAARVRSVTSFGLSYGAGLGVRLYRLSFGSTSSTASVIATGGYDRSWSASLFCGWVI